MSKKSRELEKLLASTDKNVKDIAKKLNELKKTDPAWSQSAYGLVADMRKEDALRAIEGLKKTLT